MQFSIIGIIVLALLGGGAYFFTMNTSTDDVMMADGDAAAGSEMKKDSGTMEDAMMKEGDAMVKETDVMMEKDDSMTKDGAMGEKDAAMMHGGTYEAYAAEKIAWANNGKVVLFFRASWCPTCKTVDSDIRSKLSSIPKDVTILDVNYDAETALKQKYGVTYQHTFVQVDANGNQVKKWSGSPSLAALVSEVQ